MLLFMRELISEWLCGGQHLWKLSRRLVNGLWETSTNRIAAQADCCWKIKIERAD
jgi:hypothetical protein